jgi:hypothetical protein
MQEVPVLREAPPTCVAAQHLERARLAVRSVTGPYRFSQRGAMPLNLPVEVKGAAALRCVCGYLQRPPQEGYPTLREGALLLSAFPAPHKQ